MSKIIITITFYLDKKLNYKNHNISYNDMLPLK